MAKQNKRWTTGVARAIRAPLGFFVLALLIVEAFLGSVLVGSDLTPEKKFYAVWIGVGMFLLVIVIVSILVWFKPRNLMFDQYGHLVDSGRIAPYGDNGKEMGFEDVKKLRQKEESD